MNVYVETNFVHELAFLQEQSGACERILDICESDKAFLIIPAYCLVEPLDKLHRQKNSRQEIQKSINDEIRQLSRTEGYDSRIQSIRELDLIFAQSIEEERVRFEKYRSRILDVATVLPLDTNIFLTSQTYEAAKNLSVQDSIVYASVIGHLRSGSSISSCFLNRNSKDFDIPEIRTELEQLNCRMIPRFDDGLAYIESRT